MHEAEGQTEEQQAQAEENNVHGTLLQLKESVGVTASRCHRERGAGRQETIKMRFQPARSAAGGPCLKRRVTNDGRTKKPLGFERLHS